MSPTDPSTGLSPEEAATRLARYYDLDTIDVVYDAELYQELAHGGGGPVLELGTGSGRLAIPLALAGHRVVGVDHDVAMLERGRAAWANVRGSLPADRMEFREGDFGSIRSDERFGLAFLAVNTFLLAQDDRERSDILETMRAHLQPGGTAAIELTTPDEALLGEYDGRLHHEWLRADPETGDTVSKHISARYEPEAETVRLTQIYEWTPAHGGPLWRVAKEDVLHLVEPDRLAELARQAGFGAVDLRGDHLASPYGVGSHRLILVARLV
jgi:SAM-dependent methyltransferase